MIIQLDHLNHSGHDALFLGKRKRLASCTSVRLVDRGRLLCCSLVGQRMHLIAFDRSKGSYRTLDCIPTVYAGAHVTTDLMDLDADGRIVTSNCDHASMSLYRLEGDTLSFERDVPIDDAEAGFCHGAKFVPGGKLLCATTISGAEHLYFIDRATGKVVHKLRDEGWKPKDVAFLGPRRMVVAFAGGGASRRRRGGYGSKLGLIALDEGLTCHEVLDEVRLPRCHVDSCHVAAGRVFLNNQMQDQVSVYRIAGDRLVFERAVPGFRFPHGVDYRPEDGLLAVTSYGDDNCVELRELPL